MLPATRPSRSVGRLLSDTGRCHRCASHVTRGDKDDEDKEDRAIVFTDGLSGLCSDGAARQDRHCVSVVPHDRLMGDATRRTVQSSSDGLSARRTAQDTQMCKLPRTTQVFRSEPVMHFLPSGYSQVRARGKLHALPHDAIMENHRYDSAASTHSVSACWPPRCA